MRPPAASGQSYRRTWRWSAVAFLALGAGLRILQFAADVGLWGDELAIARNVIDRPARELVASPLAHRQTAPTGFLLAEKAAVTVLGPNDYALRLFPLLSALVALVAMWKVAERTVEGLGVPVAVGLFAAAAPLIACAALVKQYSSDVAVALLLLWLVLDFEWPNVGARRAFFAAAAGAVAVGFSQPAVFVLLGLGACLAWRAWSARRAAPEPSWQSVWVVLLAWAICAIAAVLIGIASMTPATREYMRNFWAAGLLPDPPRRALETLWPLDQLAAFVGRGGLASLGYPRPPLFLSLSACGLFLLARRRPAIAACLIAPVVVTLAAAVARQYPFSEKLILFLSPVFFLGIAELAEWVRLRLSPRSALVATSAVLLLVTPAFVPILAVPPVYRIEDVKRVLAYVQTRRRPDDAVYVYYGAGAAVAFYAETFGLATSDYRIGGCHRGDGRKYYQELDTLRGRPRVWLIVSHSLGFYQERENMLRYLDAIGVRRDAFVVPSRTVGLQFSPAEAFLYDLSDTERLAATDASAFPVTGRTSPLARFGCGDGS